jgi:circadian clock protein KaiB
MTRKVLFKFRLYIARGVPNSIEAITNLNDICRIHLPDRHVIEVVDVLREPRRALEDRVIMTPTLIRLSPSPVRRVVGTLRQREQVLQALGLWNHGDEQVRESIRSRASSRDGD